MAWLPAKRTGKRANLTEKAGFPAGGEDCPTAKKVINFYYNSDIKNMLAVPAFDGKAGSYVIRSDGRIVINRTMGKGEPIYNFLAALRERSDLSEKEILAFSRELQQEQSGARTVTAGGEKFYLLYERLDIRDWITVGMVPRFGFMQPSCHFPNGKYTLPAPRKRNRKGKKAQPPERAVVAAPYAENLRKFWGECSKMAKMMHLHSRG